MKIFSSVQTLKNYLAEQVAQEKSIGFVPTMGALHEGHLSLIRKAKAENDLVVCSIFVNPTQFNDKKDLEKYPRNLDHDKRMLLKEDCDVLFTPDENEVYPSDFKAKNFDFGHLDKELEGKFRPGHFNGVAQVVARFFEIVEPNRAYFGEKDFQQLLVVKSLVKQLNLPVQIFGCPIVREENGLAMSSRNMLLSESQKNIAAAIHQSLKEAKEHSKGRTPEEIKQMVLGILGKNPEFKIEYFEVADAETLAPLKEISSDKKVIGCVALFLGDIRLIDNMYLVS